MRTGITSPSCCFPPMVNCSRVVRTDGLTTAAPVVFATCETNCGDSSGVSITSRRPLMDSPGKNSRCGNSSSARTGWYGAAFGSGGITVSTEPGTRTRPPPTTISNEGIANRPVRCGTTL